MMGSRRSSDLFHGHLVVTTHHHRYVMFLLAGFQVSGNDRLSDPLVIVVLKKSNAVIPAALLRNDRGRLVAAAVVNNEHGIDKIRHCFQSGPDEPLLVVSRYYE